MKVADNEQAKGIDDIAGLKENAGTRLLPQTCGRVKHAKPVESTGGKLDPTVTHISQGNANGRPHRHALEQQPKLKLKHRQDPENDEVNTHENHEFQLQKTRQPEHHIRLRQMRKS